MRHSKTALLFSFLLSGLSLPANALTPIRQYTDLVAGRGEEGYQDGSFTRAQFKDPCALAVNSDGTRLYVADKGNNRIRVVLLDQKNDVQTLAGTGEAGDNDGPADQAQFNQPAQVVWLPTNQLAVYETGNHRIRVIDLQTHRVTTLAGNGKDADSVDGPAKSTAVSGVWNLLYNPADDCLYFSQPALGALRRLSLKTNVIQTLLKSAPEILNPTALCIYQNQVCVADKSLPDVYTLTGLKELPTAPAALVLGKIPGLVLKPQGKVTQAIALGSSDNNLYALQTRGYSWVCLAPEARPVSMVSVSGVLFQPSFDDGEHGAFFKLSNSDTVGLVADPNDTRRFFISAEGVHAVYSFREYNFAKYSNSELIGPGITDYDYPPVKPPQTFRILVTGDSRTFSYSPDSSHGILSQRIYNLSKRLEFNLNTLAALEDIPISFQVVSYGETFGDGTPGFLWPTYVTPGIVQNFDIDMVLQSIEPDNARVFIGIYLSAPLNKWGLPGEATAQFSHLPVDKRIPPGAARELVDRGLKLKMFQRTKDGNIEIGYGSEILKDEIIQKDAAVLVGMPVSVLADELSQLKTKSGHPVIYQPFFMPVGNPADTYDNESAHQMWLSASKQYGFPLLDLTDDFIALRTSYFPVMDNVGNSHFTVTGQEWFAQILTWELIHRGLLPPFKKDAANAPAITGSPTPVP